MMADPVPEGESPAPSEITQHFIKSPHFRVLHCDGVHGGITPNGYIQMAIFSERLPIPQKVVLRTQEAGADLVSVGEEIKDRRVTRDGVIHEVDVEILLDLRTAKSLRVWLDEKITKLEEIVPRLRKKD